jgi:peptidoglycan hydrolase-like protein with peptidoglycan-binding domain
LGVRHVLAVAVVFAVMPVQAALAAAPSVSVTASPTVGAAPLTTTLTASGDAASYRWELPGGATVAGPTVTRSFPAGRWTVAALATSATGEEARTTVTITSIALTLRAPAAIPTGRRAWLTGRVVPALAGSRVKVVRAGRITARGVVEDDGGLRIAIRPRTPAPYKLLLGNVASAVVPVTIRPTVELKVAGAPVVGSSAAAVATIDPIGAGRVTVSVYRRGKLVQSRSGRAVVRLPLGTTSTAAYRVVARLTPEAGYQPTSRLLDAVVRMPDLRLGSRGREVLELAQRLSAQGYALQQIDELFSEDDSEAVLAFQKVHGLARTGLPDSRFWQVLATSTRPTPAFGGGDHIEVDKTTQVLFLVRDAKVILISHVSTGATGNTPVGTWHVYRKVVGFDWVLYYPMYFLRGFAIHGYAEVPAYPASHGCVRIPMWLAPRLFSLNGYGTTVIVHY